MIFAILIFLRPILITALALANRGSLPLNGTLGGGLAILLALPALYLGYSVKRYFGFRRAFGIDHFDPAWRDAPLVREGIFRFGSNGMYIYGFLILWIPGLALCSVAALAAAAFSHLYIWVHYHCTEKPDMKLIYGGTQDG